MMRLRSLLLFILYNVCKILDLYGYAERIPLTISLPLTSEIHSSCHVSFYLKKTKKSLSRESDHKPCKPQGWWNPWRALTLFPYTMPYKTQIACYISEPPDCRHTIALSPAETDRRNPLFQALLFNFKEHNVLHYFPSHKSLIIPFLENSIIFEVHLCLCLRPVSAYNPKVTLWWITLDSIS